MQVRIGLTENGNRLYVDVTDEYGKHGRGHIRLAALAAALKPHLDVGGNGGRSDIWKDVE